MLVSGWFTVWVWKQWDWNLVFKFNSFVSLIAGQTAKIPPILPRGWEHTWWLAGELLPTSYPPLPGTFDSYWLFHQVLPRPTVDIWKPAAYLAPRKKSTHSLSHIIQELGHLGHLPKAHMARVAPFWEGKGKPPVSVCTDKEWGGCVQPLVKTQLPAYLLSNTEHQSWRPPTLLI